MKNYEMLEQQLQTLTSCDPDTQLQRARLLCELSYALTLVDVQKSLKHAREALTLARELKNRELESLALRYHGVAQSVAGEYEKALEYYNQSLVIAREEGFEEGVASCLNNIAINLHNTGRHREALDYYQKALVIYRRIDDLSGEAICYINIGELYYDWGDHEKALDYQLRCLDIAERTDKRDISIDPLLDIGVIYSARGEKDKAMEYFQRALAISEEVGFRERASQVCSKIGQLHRANNEYDEALKYYHKALELSTEAGHKEGVSYSLHDIGQIEMARNHLDIAEEYLKQALELAREIDMKDRLASCLRNLGRVKMAQKQWTDAESFIQQSVTLAVDSQFSREAMRGYYAMSQLYEETGDYKQALEAFRAYTDVKDNIFCDERSKTITEMQTKYETEQKEKEALLLRQKNEELEASYRLLKDTQNELIRLEKRNSALALAVTAHHELNQPLMVMKGNLDMFRFETADDDLSEKQLLHLDRVEQAFNRMTQILHKFKTSTDLYFDNYAQNTPMVVFADSAIDNEE